MNKSKLLFKSSAHNFEVWSCSCGCDVLCRVYPEQRAKAWATKSNWYVKGHEPKYLEQSYATCGEYVSNPETEEDPDVLFPDDPTNKVFMCTLSPSYDQL